MSQVLKDFNRAQEKLFKHVSFEPDHVMCPLSDETSFYWHTDGTYIYFAKQKEDFGTGNEYEEEVYKQRFYDKWIYEGESLTMVMCNPYVDGVKWFRFFDNSKRVKIK